MLAAEVWPEKGGEVISRSVCIEVLAGLIISAALLCSNLWADEAERYAVQAGSFRDANSALNLLGDLRLEGFDCQSERVGKMSSVVCGDFDNSIDAERLKMAVKKEGYEGAYLVSSQNGDAPDEAMSKNYLTVQIGSYSEWKNAESILEDIESKGIPCRSRMIDGLFKVYCGQFTNIKDAVKLKMKLRRFGYYGSFPVSLPMWPFFVDVPVPVIPASPAPAEPALPAPPSKPLPVPRELYRKAPEPAPPAAEPPPVAVERTDEGIDASIFGRGGGHFHPFASVTGYYSDNIYSSGQNKVADLNTVLTGGLWVAAPGTKKAMLEGSSGALPGGVQKSSLIRERRRPYQAYMLYKVDAERYSTYEAGNFVNHRGEGLFALNRDAGHRLEVSGIYLRSHDAKGIAPVLELGKFTSRHFGATAVVAVTSRFQLRADYGQFTIDYDKDRFLYKEHKDSSYSGYMYFQFMPKTSVFLEYTSSALDYDDLYGLDSTETDYMLGLQWELTEKTTGSVKAGYSTREFDTGVREDVSSAKVVGKMSFELSEKTIAGFAISRRRKEAGIPGADFVNYLSGSARLNNHPISNFSWTLSASMAQTTYVGAGQDRKDNDLTGGLALQYQFRKWLGANFGVRHEQRTSTDASKEYSTNIVHAGLSASM